MVHVARGLTVPPVGARGQINRRLLLARHGQTAWNADGRLQGQADPPLDEVGWTQADQLATEIAPLRPGLLVSSDLLRARQTATVVSERCGLEVTTDPALREVDLGAWEGLRPPEVSRRFPDEYQRWEEGGDPRRPGGESEAQAGRRAVRGLRRIIEGSSDGVTIVIVAHGLVLRRAMSLLATSGSIDFDGPPPHLGNGQWRLFDFDIDVPS